MNKFLWVLILLFSFNIFAQNTPILSNFRIENSNKDRVFFDASGDVSGLTKQGFVISGKTITSISTSGNYFTVSPAFTFWDNNTIRLEKGNDIVFDFTLSYIVNKIKEPSTSKDIFVNANVSSSGNGISELTAYKTLTEAVKSISRGRGVKIWVKAGLYRDEDASLNGVSGRINAPIVIEGYKDTPGDLEGKMYYEYKPNQIQDKLDASKMPLFDGQDRGSNTFWDLESDSYYIFRNIQITNYYRGIRGASPKNCIVENVLFKDFGALTSNIGAGIYFESSSASASNNRILNSIIINATADAVLLSGQNNLIKNCKAYSNEAPAGLKDTDAPTDYYYLLRGSNNIVKNSLAYKDTPNGNGHSGHGFSLKANNIKTEYNLIDECESVGILGSIEFRHPEVQFNVSKNCISRGDIPNVRRTEYGTAGPNFKQGGSNNIVEGMIVHDVSSAILFHQNTEDKSGEGGSGNIVRNSIFYNISDKLLWYMNASGVNVTSEGNKIYNCIFYNSPYLFKESERTSTISLNNNKFKNNIFSNIDGLVDSKGAMKTSGWIFRYDNFYKSFDMPTGTGNLSIDPKFENASGGNFRLKLGSPMIDKGLNLDQVKFDFEGKERPQGKSIDIGAYEFEDKTTSQIKANAGEDQEICLGESVILTASGGSTYLWDNGATTASITVSPTNSKIYSVTVFKGSDSDTDEVLVTVNNVTVNAGSDVTINTGDNTILTASGGDTYLWSTGETTNSITVSPTATTTYKVTVFKNNCEATDNVKVTVSASSPPPTVKANAGEDKTICLGESVILTANGGSSYLWDNGATTASITVSPNNSKTFSVTVTEGGDSDTDEVLITVNNVTPNAGSDITINIGDSTTLTASGGDTYLWSTGETTASITVSPTATKIYKVTVTKNNCEDTDNVKVTVDISSPPPPAVVAYAGKDGVICLGESVTLIASGGSTYLWSTGATTASITVSPITTRTYSVTVSEGSDSDTDEVLITVNSVTADAGPNTTINEGENITLIASGGDSYLWSTGETTKSIIVNPINTKIYTVTVYTGNCKNSDSVQVTVNKTPLPAKANAGKDITICIGGEAKLKATGGLTYLWSTGDTNKNITVSPTRTTTYILTATRGGVSNTDTVIVTVENCNENLASDNLKNGFDVYPNPTSGILNVNIRNNISNDVNLVLISLNGSIVFSDKISSKGGNISKQIDLSRFAKGIYFVRLFNANENIVKKIMVI